MVQLFGQMGTHATFNSKLLSMLRSRNKSSFRYVKTEELEAEAEVIMKKKRNSVGKSEFLVPEPLVRKWRTKISNDNISKESLVKDTIKPHKIDPSSGTRDIDTLKVFLSVNNKEDLCLPTTVELKDAIPVGVPVLDFLTVDNRSRIDTIQYPSNEELKIYQQNRGCSYDSIYPIEPDLRVPTKEIVIGITSKEDTLLAIEYLQDNLEMDHARFPHGVISFNVKDIKITDTNLKDVFRSKGSPDWVPTTSRSKMLKTDSLVRFPTKICLGSGLRFCLVISWPVEMTDIGGYKILPTVVPKEIIDFLNDLPPLIGIGVQNDVNSVKELYSAMAESSSPLHLNKWISLESLALLCGYRLQATNATALALNIVGGLMDKMSSAADGRWCEEWEKLPIEFQIYALKDLQLSSICYNVLAAVFVKDLAPDIDAWCHMMRSNDQFAAIKQVLVWLRHSLLETEVWWNPTAGQPINREQLMKCIRSRIQPSLSTERKLKFSPPLERVMIWSDLLGPWPPITSGGPKWLHPVRYHVSKQSHILTLTTDNVLPGAKDLPKDDQMLKYLTFGQKRIQDLNSRKETRKSGLNAHPDLEFKPIDISSENLEMDYLIRLSKKQGRPLRFVICEQVRLQPQMIKVYLDKMRKDSEGESRELWLQNLHVYEDLRKMHMRIFGCDVDLIPWIEEVVENQMMSILIDEYNSYEESLDDIQIKLKRIQSIQLQLDKGNKARRTDRDTNLPSVMMRNDIKSPDHGIEGLNLSLPDLHEKKFPPPTATVTSEQAAAGFDEVRVIKNVGTSRDQGSETVNLDHLESEEDEVMIVGETAGRRVVELENDQGTSFVPEPVSRPPTPFPFTYTQSKEILRRQVGSTKRRKPIEVESDQESSDDTTTESGESSSTDESSDEGTSDSESNSDDSSSSDGYSKEDIEKLCKIVKQRIHNLKKEKRSKIKSKSKSKEKSSKKSKDEDFMKYLDDFEKELK